MVSAATKRKRRDRGNRVATAIEDGRGRSSAERKTLGTTVAPNVPDAMLFKVDRKGQTKASLQKEFYEQASEQRKAAKRARRAKPKMRRSEAALVRPDDGLSKVRFARKKKGVASVDMEILAKRKFDKPRGHVGNVSDEIRKAKVYTNGKEDVWTGDMSKVVEKEIGVNRLRMTKIMNSARREAVSVLHPTAGLSINPTHEDHQDKLGEALSKIVAKDNDAMWDDAKMNYDPALLEESREGEVADTGMKDGQDDNQSQSENEDDVLVSMVVPERKTRSQRNKEARKRVMASNIIKKRKRTRRLTDFDNIAILAEEAKQLADKVSGEEKKRKLELNPPPPKQANDPVLEKIAGQKVRNEMAVEPVAFSSELSEAMRSVKMPVANPMLRDRFLSFERRGLIEPPKVLPKEIWRMEQARQQEERRDKRKRKGRGSRSNLNFWRNGKSVIQ